MTEQRAENESAENVLDQLFSPQPRSVRRLPTLVKSGIAIAWRAAPRELLTNAALQAVSAAAVGGQLLATQRLLRALIELGDDPRFLDVVPWLAVLSVLTAVASVADLVRIERQRLLGEMVGLYTIDQVLDVATSVELVAFDSSEFHNRLMRAQINATVRPVQMANGILGIASALITIAAVSAALLLIEPLLVVALLVAYLPAWALNARASHVSYSFSVDQTERDRERSYLAVVLARRAEAAELRAYNIARFLRGRHDALYGARLHALRDIVRRRTRLGLVGASITSLLNAGALALLVWFVVSGRLDIAAAGASAGAMLIFAQRLSVLASSTGALYESALFIEDFTSFVEPRPHLDEGLPEAPPSFGEIRLDGITFRYPNAERAALTDVSLSVRKGEVIALVGENGSGKTTLAKLLGGLYRPAAGSISWDDTDLTKVDPSSVRDRVAVIFQDFVKYHFSARDNIALGRVDEFDNSTGVLAAAQRASADEFLDALPRGFDTVLGSEYAGSSDLSIGQWQRVALARAFFRDAPLLILDEPTAALDARSEARLFDQIKELYAGRTVVLISHRLSSVRSADQIYVLDHGQIVEAGTHEELMRSDGTYAEMFTLQASAYADEVEP
ncbi:MAG: ABC transporter ATP-binding protein [Ilumatobacteraceae bacterium]